MIERLLQFALAGLLGFEQSRVLNGDDRLICEGLEQIDLSVGELADLSTSDGDHANGLAHAHQRNGQYGAVVYTPSPVATLRVFTHFGLYSGVLNRFPVANGM